MRFSILWAYCLLVIAQSAIAVNVVSGKFLIETVPIHVYLCGRFMASTIFLYLLVRLSRQAILIHDKPLVSLHRKDWFYLMMQALTGGFLFNVMFYWGIQFTTAISAGIISSVLPAMIAVCAFLILGEKMGKWQYIGITLAMTGILVINLDNAKGADHVTGSFLGDSVILLSMIPEALYSIFNKFTNQKVTPMGGALIVNALIFLMLLPFGAYEYFAYDLSIVSLNQWLLVFGTGFASLFFFWFWGKGLLVVPASTAAIFTSVLPVSTTLMAWAFLNEFFSIYDGIGMFFVLFSIAIGTGWLPSIIKHKKLARAIFSSRLP